MFQISTSAPPGRSTRCNSGSARSWSNQWNAWATVIASTDASGERQRLGRPVERLRARRRLGELRAHLGDRLDAITRAPVGTSSRVSFPVPAPTSTTTRPGPSPACSTIQATASAGYDGRARS